MPTQTQARDMSMRGRIMAVTGANSGIGYETALGLAHVGATVVMVCRSREKGEAARAQIIESTGNPDIHLMLADLGVIAQVKALAEDFGRRFDRLHALVNNAAIVPIRRMLTTDGLETQFAVNHLSYFMLGNLLLPNMKETGRDNDPARIINVSSGLHPNGRVEWDNLQSEKHYRFYRIGGPGWGTYSNTKLFNVMFTYEMARRLNGTGASVTINATDPGLNGTNLSRAMPGPIHRIYLALTPKPENGARTSIYLATSPEVVGMTGKYFRACKEERSAPVSYDVHSARRLWEISAQIAGITTI